MKKELDIITSTKRKVRTISLLNQLQTKDVRTCNYCFEIGHIAYSCAHKKYISRIVQIWVPKGTRSPNMAANDFESRYKVKSGRNV